MANLNAIARPYAQAAYEFARDKKELPQWAAMLHAASEVVQQPLIAKALSNNRIPPQKWLSLMSDVLASSLDGNRKNFLRLLTDNRRLETLPTILDFFKEYEARDNQLSEVEVISAVPLDQEHQQKLQDKLTKVLKHRVSLRCAVDENILGGVIVRAGDKVIDGSIRGQLTRLLEFAIR